MYLIDDFREMLSALNDAGADCIVVGGYAMAAIGSPRATGDIDIWVRPTPENSTRVYSALRAFRAPLEKISPEDFATAEIVFQMGLPPQRIDLITSIDGVQFEEAWERRRSTVVDGIEISFLSETDLLTNKTATGREKDLGDAAWIRNRRQAESD